MRISDWSSDVCSSDLTIKLLRGQIAYRILSVKLLSLNGEMDEDTYSVHSQLTPDEPENSELRGLLRDASATSGDGWIDQARIVRHLYGADPLQLLDRLEMLVVHLAATPQALRSAERGVGKEGV